MFLINLDTFLDELKQKIKLNKNKVDELLKIKNKTYKNFVWPFELISVELDELFTKISHINSVKNSKKTNEVYEKSLPIFHEYSSWISQNVDIYKSLKDILNNEKSFLNSEQLRVLELEIKDYILSGCELNKEKKDKLKKINLKLSELGNDFSQNLLRATNDFKLECFESDIKRMPKSIKQLYKINNERYSFSLQAPSYIAFMTYSNNRDLREKLYKAYSTKAPENEDLIEKIVKLKEEKAKILGFKNYTNLSLQTKMADSEEEVLEFLYEIVKYAKPKAYDELEEIKQLALEDGVKDLASFDLSYYSQILKERYYQIDEEFYKQYFEKNNVVEGLFNFLNSIFDIKFKKIDEKSWDESVFVYEILENNQVIAKLYLDLESRDDKKNGAWMHDWSVRYSINNKFQLPSAFVVANFTPARNNLPSLLTHEEVVTLFHEIGHALHHLLTKVDEPFVSGINGVEWDGVEFPSQFLEYFAYEKDVLKTFALNYKTKEVLDDSSIERLKKSRNFQSALQTVRQIEFALFDFKLYQKAINKVEIQKLLDEIRKEVAVIIPPSYNKFQNSFSHIFAGGYSAGYYSYKWAEVMSADSFMLFKGNINKDLFKKYKEIVLYRGGSRSMGDIFRDFCGKKPDIKSLLKIDGIIN